MIQSISYASKYYHIYDIFYKQCIFLITSSNCITIRAQSIVSIYNLFIFKLFYLQEEIKYKYLFLSIKFKQSFS